MWRYAFVPSLIVLRLLARVATRHVFSSLLHFTVIFYKPKPLVYL
jgi:hypothetical protein